MLWILTRWNVSFTICEHPLSQNWKSFNPEMALPNIYVLQFSKRLCWSDQHQMLVHITLLLDHRYHGDEKKSAAPITSFPPFIAASWCQQLSWDKKKKRRFLPGAGGIITCDRHHSTLSQGGGPEERKVLENKRRGVKGGRRPKEGGVQIGGIKGGSLVHAFHVWNITSVLDFLNVLWRRNLG